MFDSIANYNAHFKLNDYEYSGVDSISFESQSSTSTSKLIGSNRTILTNSGPVNQTLTFSRYIVSSETGDIGLFNMTGDAANRGSLIYKDNNLSFKSGYLTNYSINCAVGSLPKANYSLDIFDEMKGISIDDSPSPEIDVILPSQGSIRISTPESSSNRVIGFNFNASVERAPIYNIGSLHPHKIISSPTVIKTASVQIQVDDGKMLDGFSFLREKENEEITFSIDSRNGEGIISNSIKKASTVSENLSISSNGLLLLTINYEGE